MMGSGGINHLRLYRHMDVALDPIPYGGATTTAEALWMGIPVVCLQGAGMVGRLSASLLHHAGLEGWSLTADLDSYISIAKTSGCRDLGVETRLKLRNNLAQSAIANGKQLSTELEKIYKELRQGINFA